MKVIDLLSMISKGEEVPKKIKYRDWLYEFEKDCNDYLCQYDSLLYRENDDVKQFLNDEVEILEEEKKTIDDLNLTLQEIEVFNEARQIFLKLNNEEDKQIFAKLLFGEGTYERWIDYLKSKGDE